MFSSLKLNSLKCQSNGGGGGGGGSDCKKEKCEYEDEDDLSDHMYEKLPNYDNKPCKCHLNNFKFSTKPTKTSFSKRISKWRMECPGITNLRNTHNEFKNNDEESIRELPNSEQLVRTKITTVNVQREDGSLGITLRGGFHQNANLSRPVVITFLKPDGPAAREGTIKPGDRLLAVDGVSLQGSSLNEAQTLLRQPSATALLTIEYDVNVLDSVEHASGPLLVEIERTSKQQLGLTLLQNENGIIIERVKPGSLADRCGALHVGDEILAVNATRVDRASVSLEDVMRILECECPLVRLEILPTYAATCYPNYGTWRARENNLSYGTPSGFNTLKGSRKNRECRKDEMECGVDYKANHINPHGVCGAEIALTHCDTLHTTLTREEGSFGLQFIEAPDGTVLINSVTPGGPAEKSQCLHPGDRLLAINHRSVALDNLTANDINDLLEYKSEVSCSKLSLHTEFDVLDTVVPASGIFTVKLVKRGSGGLGITMTASKSSGFIVCEMKKGSIAHRAGSLVPGDKLLAINNIPLDQCSVEYAAHILHQSSNIVTLKVQREDNSEVRNGRRITYTVDLQRFGGPIGITIAGSEEPFQPITISGLTSGGLAEQTGVIHVGDEILAINNHSLCGEPLSKAHSLLQSSTDLVTLKLSRSIVPICRMPNRGSPILPSSIDSAVESWDSSRLDLTSSPDHQKITRDPRDYKSNIQQWPLQCSTFRSPATEKTETALVTNNNYDLAILDEITSENLKIKQELDLLSIKLDEQRKSKLQEEESENNSFANNNNISSTEDNELQSVKTSDVCPLNISDENIDKKVIYSEVKPLDKNFENEYTNATRESVMTTDLEQFEMTFMPETRNWCKSQFGSDNIQDSIRSEFQSSQLYEVTLYKDPVYEDFGFSVSDGLYERGVFINRIRKGGPADLSNVLKPYDRILQVNETYTQDFDCCLTVPLIASAGDSLVLLVARNYCNSEHLCYRPGLYNPKLTTDLQVIDEVFCLNKPLRGLTTRYSILQEMLGTLLELKCVIPPPIKPIKREANGSDKIHNKGIPASILHSNSREELQRILV